MIRRGRSTFLALALLAATPLSILTACPSAKAAIPGQEIVERALGAADRAERIAALERALDGASDEESPWIALNLAEQIRLSGDSKEARKAFKDPGKAGGAIGDAAALGTALAELAEGKDSMQVLREVAERSALDTQNADRYAMLAKDAQRRGATSEVEDFTKKALRYASVDPAVERRLRKALAGGGGEDETPAPGTGDAELLDGAVAAGDRDQVQAIAARIRASAEAGSDDAALADYALRRVGLQPDPKTIAVLLPMSGKYRGVGNQLKKALQLGWGGGAGGRKLVFLDTGEDEKSARAAAEKAIFELRAIAVVGPLRSEVANDVAQVAQATRTPMLGMHQDGEAADDRPWVMDGFSTPEAQVDGLVAHVMQYDGMESFAIFAPDNAYGRAAADAFTKAVEARGGTITVREHYDTEAQDLIPFAKKLGRKDYKARAAEWARVKREVADAGGDPSRAVLPPVIDFDGIFVPDGWRRIPVAAAGLAYEEFPVGEFRITPRGPTVPLLGLSGWNNEQLVTAGGPYVRNSRFVDVFLPDDSAVREFVNGFRQEAGKDPSTLEAQTWTVGRVLRAAARADASTREAFRKALLDATVSDATATGATGIDDATRRIDHTVRVLSLNKDGIFVVKSPEPDAPE